MELQRSYDLVDTGPEGTEELTYRQGDTIWVKSIESSAKWRAFDTAGTHGCKRVCYLFGQLFIAQRFHCRRGCCLFRRARDVQAVQCKREGGGYALFLAPFCHRYSANLVQ
jgi:hypothetical protein